jgi:hypothetical protein
MYLLDGWTINIIGTNYPTIIRYLPEQYPLSVSLPARIITWSCLVSVPKLNYPYPVPYLRKYIRVGYGMTLYPAICVPFSSLCSSMSAAWPVAEGRAWWGAYA